MRRARRRGGGPEGRRLGGGRPRGGGPHRSPRRRPAGLPRPWSRRPAAAWARDPHELLELARSLAAPRARPARPDRAGLAVLTCSGGDSGVAADLRRGAGTELPELGERHRRPARGPAAGDGDPRQPARLHLADLGRPRAARGDRRGGRRRPGGRPAAAALRPPGGSAPEHETRVDRRQVRPGRRGGALRRRRDDRLDAPGPARRPSGPRARRTRNSRRRRARHGPALHPGPPLRPPRTRRLRDDCGSRTRASGRGSARVPTAGWPRRRGSPCSADAGVPVPDGAELDLDDERGCLDARSRARLAGGAEALRPTPPPQERGGRGRAGNHRRRGAASRLARGSARCPRPPARGCCSSGWPTPASRS